MELFQIVASEERKRQQSPLSKGFAFSKEFVHLVNINLFIKFLFVLYKEKSPKKFFSIIVCRFCKKKPCKMSLAKGSLVKGSLAKGSLAKSSLAKGALQKEALQKVALQKEPCKRLPCKR